MCERGEVVMETDLCCFATPSLANKHYNAIFSN